MTHAFRFYILWRLSILNNEFIAAFTFHVVQRSAILLKTPMRWSNTTAIILWKIKNNKNVFPSLLLSFAARIKLTSSPSQVHKYHKSARATVSHIARWNFIQRFYEIYEYYYFSLELVISLKVSRFITFERKFRIWKELQIVFHFHNSMLFANMVSFIFSLYAILKSSTVFWP